MLNQDGELRQQGLPVQEVISRYCIVVQMIENCAMAVRVSVRSGSLSSMKAQYMTKKYY
jgi:hypothetical protein